LSVFADRLRRDSRNERSNDPLDDAGLIEVNLARSARLSSRVEAETPAPRPLDSTASQRAVTDSRIIEIRDEVIRDFGLYRRSKTLTEGG
jgi:hypothetical protein